MHAHTHTHACTHIRIRCAKNECTHARTHVRMHARTHARTASCCPPAAATMITSGERQDGANGRKEGGREGRRTKRHARYARSDVARITQTTGTRIVGARSGVYDVARRSRQPTTTQRRTHGETTRRRCAGAPRPASPPWREYHAAHNINFTCVFPDGGARHRTTTDNVNDHDGGPRDVRA